MSWIIIWVHLVFSTKNREPFLKTPEIRNALFEHIKFNAKEKEIWLDEINGYKEHIHCLISLGKEQTISKIAQLIKGESSYWINKKNLIKEKFIWQDDYWALSVSESQVKEVKKYIQSQEEHHRIKNFSEEFEEFMNKYGWKFIKQE